MHWISLSPSGIEEPVAQRLFHKLNAFRYSSAAVAPGRRISSHLTCSCQRSSSGLSFAFVAAETGLGLFR